MVSNWLAPAFDFAREAIDCVAEPVQPRLESLGKLSDGRCNTSSTFMAG